MQLSTELVHTGKWDIFTTSVKVAEYLEVPHKFLIKTIDRLIKKIESEGDQTTPTFDQKFVETVTVNKQKREYRTYDMNEQAFMKLVMNLWQYKKAFEIQSIFIKAFFQMRNVLQQHTNASWIESRETGKIERLAETDTIKDFVDYAEKQGNTKARFYYSTLTKMTYKALELVNCETPIRDILNSVWLQYLAELERQVQYELQDGMKNWLDYKHIYANTKERITRYCDFIPKRVQLKIWN